MELDTKELELLKEKYRNPIFETENVDLKNIDSLISDEDLKRIIKINNDEMCELVNEGKESNRLLKRLFMANINFYRLALYRKISIPGKSIMLMIETTINYTSKSLHDFDYYSFKEDKKRKR